MFKYIIHRYARLLHISRILLLGEKVPTPALYYIKLNDDYIVCDSNGYHYDDEILYFFFLEHQRICV